MGRINWLIQNIDYKDLGLLIVDEEHKFGVGVKDKLKTLRENIDTLTLTATPIPRTLQFSLMAAEIYRSSKLLRQIDNLSIRNWLVLMKRFFEMRLCMKCNVADKFISFTIDVTIVERYCRNGSTISS